MSQTLDRQTDVPYTAPKKNQAHFQKWTEIQSKSDTTTFGLVFGIFKPKIL